MSLDYQRNNVKVIASDAGVTACHNGGTHMSFEDMGIVRGLANSVVLEVMGATRGRERALWSGRDAGLSAERVWPDGGRYCKGGAGATVITKKKRPLYAAFLLLGGT